MYQLKSCVWELTKACTMRCMHCGSQAGAARGDELKEPEAFRIADQLIELGCTRVTLIGGEVTLCSYWARLAGYLSDHGMVCDIVTNGYHKTEQDYLDFQDSHIASAAISLDGMEELHNWIRGQGDAFTEAERFCLRMAKTKIPLTAVTTITKMCVEELGTMYDWLGRQGIRVWQWQQVSPMGNAGDHAALALETEDIERVIDSYADLSSRGGMPIVLGDNLGYYVERERGLIHPFHGCAAGLSVIGIDSEGNVRGCESLYDQCYTEGNLRKISLREIWESPDSFSYNRKFIPNLLSGKCLACSVGAVCAGGCRSFNAFHGALYEHTNCIREYNPLLKASYPMSHEEKPQMVCAGPTPCRDRQPSGIYPNVHEEERLRVLYAGPPVPD